MSGAAVLGARHLDEHRLAIAPLVQRRGLQTVPVS